MFWDIKTRHKRSLSLGHLKKKRPYNIAKKYPKSHYFEQGTLLGTAKNLEFLEDALLYLFFREKTRVRVDSTMVNALGRFSISPEEKFGLFNQNYP